jgi:hypothetical protein
MSSSELESLFSHYGELRSVAIGKNEAGQARGFAFVNYLKKENAQAVTKKNYIMVDGAALENHIQLFVLFSSVLLLFV